MGVEPCAHEFYPATWWAPAEYCTSEANVSGFCDDHEPCEPDWDALRKDLLRYDDY